MNPRPIPYVVIVVAPFVVIAIILLLAYAHRRIESFLSHRGFAESRTENHQTKLGEITVHRANNMPKKVEVKIGGDHLAALIRPVLGGLASMAIQTGYPSKSTFIAGTAKRLMQVAKRGNANELTTDDRKVLAFLIARALRETGNEAVAVAAGDRLVLVVDPPKGRVTSPQVLLTLTGGLQAAVVADEDKPKAVLPGDLNGTATVELPWDRTAATYEGLPVTVELVVPTDAEYVAVFNAA